MKKPFDNKIMIEGTRFIYLTNLSGDPKRDTFGSSTRKCNIVIPDVDQAQELIADGFNVKCTKPREGEEEGFVPEYFVSVNANFDSSYPPAIKLVSGDGDPLALDEETVGIIDTLNDDRCVGNVDVILNPYINKTTNRKSLYIKTMYVVQDFSADPFMNKYYGNNVGPTDDDE